MNSGLFYLRANPRTVDLMRRLEYRLAREKYWDQTAYNEELFRPAHGDYKSPQARAAGADGGRAPLDCVAGWRAAPTCWRACKHGRVPTCAHRLRVRSQPAPPYPPTIPPNPHPVTTTAASI